MTRSVVRVSKRRSDTCSDDDPYLYILLSDGTNITDACIRTKKREEWNLIRGEESWTVSCKVSNASVARIAYLYNVMMSMNNISCYNDIFREKFSRDKFIDMLRILHPVQLARRSSFDLEFRLENTILDVSLESRVLSIWSMKYQNVRSSTRFLGDRNILDLMCPSCVFDDDRKRVVTQCFSCKESDNFHLLYRQAKEKTPVRFESVYTRLLPVTPRDHIYLVPAIAVPYPEDIDTSHDIALGVSASMYDRHKILLEQAEKYGTNSTDKTHSLPGRSNYWTDYDLLQKAITML